MSAFKDVWASIYEQVHNHLRDGARKRDQIVAFYLVLLAALVGAWDKLQGYRPTVLAILWVLGVASLAVSVLYWRWHIVHNCSMVVIQRIRLLDSRPTLADCEHVWNAVNLPIPTLREMLNPFRGVETMVLYFHAALTFVPAYLLMRTSSIQLLSTRYDAVAFLVDVVLYSGLLVSLSVLYVRRFYSFREQEWPFRWLRPVAEPLPSKPNAL